MEVILRRDVDKLGKQASKLKVKDGYARNFLIPQGLAFEATNDNLRKLELEERHRHEQEAKEKKLAQDLALKLKGTSCTVSVDVNEHDKMYGSVTSMDIIKALEQEGYTNIDKKSILLDAPIQDLGIYDLEVKLHPEVITKIRVWVTKR